MGDTGSMFLGGMVTVIAFGLGIPVYLILLGLIYIAEGLSVVIQTSFFKFTRLVTGTPRRLFKMSPIHHHFEMSGWKEPKVVFWFCAVQLLACIAAVYALIANLVDI
jgi:phospho-N-acetylmuramoyl-pentapeptide-transferase